jgi:HPt (histidine-containing phosphotransfer) domain-containing protein
MEKQEISGMNQEIIAGILQSSKFNHLKSERFDPESLWERIDGDIELLRELIEVFSEEGPRMMARVEDAIRNGSALDLEKAGHKMKGSVLQFSATAAAAVAARLEEKGRSGSVAGAGPLVEQLKQEIELLQNTLNSMLSSGRAD